MKRLRRMLGALAVVIFCAAPVLAGVEYTITDLGPASSSPAYGWPQFASGINNNGQVVGWYGWDNTALPAWEYDHGTLTNLGTLAQTSNYGWAISQDGTTVVGSYAQSVTANHNTAAALHALVWVGGTPTDINPTGATYSEAVAINLAGAIVGDADGYATYRASGQSGPMTNLNTLLNSLNPGSGWSLQYAMGINDSGMVTGVGTNSSSANEMYVLNTNSGAVTDIGSADDSGWAAAINDNGEVVGSSASGIAFSWTSGGGMVSLGTLADGTSSSASAVNSQGIAVGSSDPYYGDANYQAVIFSGGSVTALSSLIPSDSGWLELNWATGINDNGQIVGTGYNALGYQDAFLLTPVPEPISMIFFGTGVVGVLGYVARRRMQRN